jgi:hypothetical protein
MLCNGQILLVLICSGNGCQEAVFSEFQPADESLVTLYHCIQLFFAGAVQGIFATYKTEYDNENFWQRAAGHRYPSDESEQPAQEVSGQKFNGANTGSFEGFLTLIQ